MKNLISLVLVIIVCLACFIGCGSQTKIPENIRVSESTNNSESSIESNVDTESLESTQENLNEAANAAIDKGLSYKDDAAMTEVVNAVMMSLSDPVIYDEVMYSVTSGNVSCYIDKESESDYEELKLQNNNNEYSFDDNARIADGNEYYFAGNMVGFTLTFVPVENSDGTFGMFIGDAIVNAGLVQGARVANDRISSDIAYHGGNEWSGDSLSHLSTGPVNDGKNCLYNRLRATVGDLIRLASSTYRNSSYTIFVHVENEQVRVYGQWNGTHLG